MPTITFECLAPAAEIDAAEGRLRGIVAGLLGDGSIGSAEIAGERGIAVDQEFRAQWADLREGEDAPTSAARFVVRADGLAGSVNGLAMRLAAAFTEDVEVPADPLTALHADEPAALFPWSLDVRP